LTIPQFIAGLNIDGFGQRQSSKLVDNGYSSFDLIYEITEKQMTAIEGFGDKIYESFKNAFVSNYFKIENVLKTGCVAIEVPKEILENKLTGKSFCFTGKLFDISRKDAEKLVKDSGGRIIGVSPKLDFLVCNDISSASSKVKKAEKHNIKIISEKEFSELGE